MHSLCLQLLGLQSGQIHKDSVVNKAYDELLTTPLEPGYSAQIATGRAEVLEIVRTVLITSKNKPLDKREKDVLIPYDLLPGALALLAEVRTMSACRFMTCLSRETLLDTTETYVLTCAECVCSKYTIV